MSTSLQHALTEFTRRARELYGDRLRGLYLFGSQAREDAEDGSDADVIVVLADGEWDFWQEKRRLIAIAFELVLDNSLYVQAWPISESRWSGPEMSSEAAFLQSARREAKPFGAVA
jgi:predicted nucleotidyltransferase